jgi:lysozyme family protein
MNVNADKYITDLLAREGGFVDHPADRGGATNHGITERVARAFGYHGSMRDLPRSVARSIYIQRYWEAPGFHLVAEYSAPVAEELLDTGVNMGPAVAGRFLQRALNVLNSEGKHYPDIVADGAVGRMTIAALRAYIGARGKDAHTVLLRALNSQQAMRYIEIAEGRPSQESFVHGWLLHRVA